MNMESLWDQACALLSREMPYVSYSTWVDGNMVPGILEDDTLTTRKTLTKKTIPCLLR